MPKTAPFESWHARYEQWFDRHPAAYVSELLALRPFVPLEGSGLEIGVGTGRFAAPLGVAMGLDPSPAMLAAAAARGIKIVQAVAEQTPFAASSFNYALIVTTICFVDSPARMLSEAHRVLKPGGRVIVGFIDRTSTIGRDYEANRTRSVFYRDATFYAAAEVEQLLVDAGFAIDACAQTLFHPLERIQDVEAAKPSRGRGAFVVITAIKHAAA